jgi:hypothetical protein
MKDEAANEIHSIYAVHQARHNVAMLRICREGRNGNDLLATLKSVSEEMQTYCTCGSLLSSNHFHEFVEFIFMIMPPEDVESMRVLFKQVIEDLKVNETN